MVIVIKIRGGSPCGSYGFKHDTRVGSFRLPAAAGRGGPTGPVSCWFSSLNSDTSTLIAYGLGCPEMAFLVYICDPFCIKSFSEPRER